MLTNFEMMPEQNLDEFIPTDAFNKGYRLTWYNPIRMGHDPTILFLHGFEVFRWEYDPTMGEVWAKIKELDT